MLVYENDIKDVQERVDWGKKVLHHIPEDIQEIIYNNGHMHYFERYWLIGTDADVSLELRDMLVDSGFTVRYEGDRNCSTPYRDIDLLLEDRIAICIQGYYRCELELVEKVTRNIYKAKCS